MAWIAYLVVVHLLAVCGVLGFVGVYLETRDDDVFF